MLEGSAAGEKEALRWSAKIRDFVVCLVRSIQMRIPLKFRFSCATTLQRTVNIPVFRNHQITNSSNCGVLQHLGETRHLFLSRRPAYYE